MILRRAHSTGTLTNYKCISLISLQVLARRKNRNAPEGIQRQQVRVAGDDYIRPTMHRNFQKFVVARIAAGADGGEFTTINPSSPIFSMYGSIFSG